MVGLVLATTVAVLAGLQLARRFEGVVLPHWAEPLTVFAVSLPVLLLVPGEAEWELGAIIWTVAFLVPLVALAAIDAATHRLPDSLSILLIALGLLRIGTSGQGWLLPALIAAALVVAGLLIDWAVPEAPVGAGDFLLLGGLLVWVGAPLVLELAILAALLVWLHVLALVVIGLIRQHRTAPPSSPSTGPAVASLGQGVPFAPALALAAAILWFAGSPG